MLALQKFYLLHFTILMFIMIGNLVVSHITYNSEIDIIEFLMAETNGEKKAEEIKDAKEGHKWIVQNSSADLFYLTDLYTSRGNSAPITDLNVFLEIHLPPPERNI
ncbi:MAG: hypothetical protein KJP00_15885 [Bacteroidia bacterium]|nr:hypothetical protein [Bacteroidia bacterium]